MFFSSAESRLIDSIFRHPSIGKVLIAVLNPIKLVKITKFWNNIIFFSHSTVILIIRNIGGNVTSNIISDRGKNCYLSRCCGR